MSLHLPPPCDIGLPARFQSWRPGQVEAIEFAIDDPRRFKGLVLPTGAGKSAIYMTIPRLTGWRTVVLTSTKALQRQLSSEFGDDETTALMQGQRSYECVAVQPGRELAPTFGSATNYALTVDQGPCHAGVSCSLMEGGCGYYDAIRAIMKANVVITNYAWWFTLVMNSKITLRPDLLVLDEAHAAPDALADAIGATIKCGEVREFLPTKHFDMPDIKDSPAWVQWAGRAATHLARLLEGTRAHDRETARRLRRAQSLQYAVSRISKIEPALLIVTPEMDGAELKFDVVWAAEYAEPWLFRNVPRVVLTSATMSKHTGEMLGLVDKDLGLYEAGEGFDKRRRPVYVYPAMDFLSGSRINVDHRIDARREELWLQHVDRILAARADRRVIIHSVSYRRRDHIMAKSAHRERMMTHGRHDTAERIAQFRSGPRNAVLVSPSVTTGYDFPFDECEVQIVAKIPFPDGRDPITSVRSIVDKKYPSYLAMQQLVQMAGRGMRAADDQCETFIVDGHASWFLSKHADLAPKWFRRAVSHVTDLPAAPPRLNVNHPPAAEESTHND